MILFNYFYSLSFSFDNCEFFPFFFFESKINFEESVLQTYYIRLKFVRIEF